MDRNYREFFVRIFLGAILIASLGSLAACGGGGSSTPLPPASGSVVWSLASNPTSSPSVYVDDEPWGMVQSGGSLYIVGYDSNTTMGDDQWRIEKRNTSDGSLVASFGTATGVVVSNLSSGPTVSYLDDAYAVAADSAAIYVVGFDSMAGPDDLRWHIEKRDLVTGATVTLFGNNGVISESTGTLFLYGEAFAVAVDPRSTGMLYTVGYEDTVSQGAEWRIEARDKSTGSLVSWVTPTISNSNDYAYAIAIDPDEGYMYVAGSDDSSGAWRWRIEKRTLSAPLSLETTTFGGGSGFVQSDLGVGVDEPYAIAMDKDAGYLYIAGYEQYSVSPPRFRWRIEKRYMFDGALEKAQFGGGTGFVVSSTTTNAVANAIAIDANYMYVAGYDNTSSGAFEWRIEKRDLATGALVTSFGSGGVVVNAFGSTSYGFDDSARAIAVDSAYVYVAGYETVSYDTSSQKADSRWRVMKLLK